MINAKIIADSTNEFGDRITTLEVVMPRIVLAEFNTHRMFSRNSASSRAIPFKRMVKMVQDNPFVPVAWQKEHTGMQGTEYLPTDDKITKLTTLDSPISSVATCEKAWLLARDRAVEIATVLTEVEATKQLANRLLEPFMYHKVIVTATEWENFFKLRCPQYHSPVDTHFRHRSKKDCIAAHSNPVNLELMDKMTDVEWLQINESQAEIHIQAVSEAMWDAMNESTPTLLKAGEWHIPYGKNIDWEHAQGQLKRYDKTYPTDLAIKIATARCARVSYTTVGDDGKVVVNDYAKDLILHDRLAESGHWSPFEHCAKAITEKEHNNLFRKRNNESKGWCNNFRGFIQYRSIKENN